MPLIAPQDVYMAENQAAVLNRTLLPDRTHWPVDIYCQSDQNVWRMPPVADARRRANQQLFCTYHSVPPAAVQFSSAGHIAACNLQYLVLLAGASSLSPSAIALC